MLTSYKEVLFFIQDYLLKYSDENHIVKFSDIKTALDKEEMPIADSTLREYIKTTCDYLGAVVRRGKYAVYYINEHPFTLAELKILVDSVQASKFLSQKRTAELISKLESLTSVFEAKQLHRSVFISKGIKSEDESIFMKVDTIYNAIDSNHSIVFKYCEYGLDKKLIQKNGGKSYNVSPFSLIWDNENYYLLSYDNDRRDIRHYRVDKMVNIKISSSKRIGKEVFSKIDISSYRKQIFGMFSGDVSQVKIRFKNNLIGAALDILGKDIMIIPDGKDHFIAITEVALSPHFYGWLFAFGKDAKLIYPFKAVKKMQDMAQEILSRNDD